MQEDISLASIFGSQYGADTHLEPKRLILSPYFRKRTSCQGLQTERLSDIWGCKCGTLTQRAQWLIGIAQKPLLGAKVAEWLRRQIAKCRPEHGVNRVSEIAVGR
ncbi:hypothetical protein AY586_12240 [Marichromatium gracile]|uniref:Uncharacterized protein n=1 Tax=Marichromatium gracile TaxID=1048 RepID=A0ABR5VHG2_MARGR|nr:hypothetical protein AY586_12240 [Marichromatium gracile]